MLLTGKIIFDPKNVTKKHSRQGTWKKTAMVLFSNTELDAMWRWYLYKRFKLITQQPLRKAHTTFINDRYTNDIKWKETSLKYKNKKVSVDISSILKSDNEHWWLTIDKYPEILYDIRSELGLSREPYFKPHFTVGLVNWRNLEHSKYIKRLLKRKDIY